MARIADKAENRLGRALAEVNLHTPPADLLHQRSHALLFCMGLENDNHDDLPPVLTICHKKGGPFHERAALLH